MAVVDAAAGDFQELSEKSVVDLSDGFASEDDDVGVGDWHGVLSLIPKGSVAPFGAFSALKGREVEAQAARPG